MARKSPAVPENRPNDKGVIVDPREVMPNDPENLHISKKKFVEKRLAYLKKKGKIKEYEKTLDAEEASQRKAAEKKSAGAEQPSVEAGASEPQKETAKPKGRPKKIE